MRCVAALYAHSMLLHVLRCPNLKCGDLRQRCNWYIGTAPTDLYTRWPFLTVSCPWTIQMFLHPTTNTTFWISIVSAGSKHQNNFQLAFSTCVDFHHSAERQFKPWFNSPPLYLWFNYRTALFIFNVRIPLWSACWKYIHQSNEFYTIMSFLRSKQWWVCKIRTLTQTIR